MVNRLRISGILYLLSTVILMYCVWFKVTFTLELMALSWTLLAMSRALIMFPHIGRKAEVKIGKEIKQKMNKKNLDKNKLKMNKENLQ